MLEKLILSKLSEYMDEQEVKTRVGRISQELQDKFEANRAAHEAEHEALSARIDALIEQIQKEHSCDKFHEVDLELWEEVYDELGFTEEERGLRYTIPHGARVVFRKDGSDQNMEDLIKKAQVAVQ